MEPKRATAVVAVLAVAAAVTLGVELKNRPEPVVAEAPSLPATDASGAYTPAELPGEAGPALAAAVTTAPLAVTYDYRDLPGSVTRATAGMTPDFASEFTTTFDRTAKPLAQGKKAVTQGVVRAAGVVRLTDPTHALCLVYLDQLLVSSETMKRKQTPINVSQNRVLVGVELVDGSWRVSSIDPA